MFKIGDFLLPGDTIQDLKTYNNVLLLGPGLRKHTDETTIIVVTRYGKLRFKHPNVYWIENTQKRYVPKKGELVIGVVTAKRGDLLKVDIGSSELASLLLSAFEGATKKQKPDVQVGDVVYARLLSATREMEPELVCIDSYYKAGRLGILSNEGFIFNIDQGFAHKLLNFNFPLLRTLGRNTPYEIVIGMNGKVWINSHKTSDINFIFKFLQTEEYKTKKNIDLCKK